MNFSNGAMQTSPPLSHLLQMESYFIKEIEKN